MNRQPAEDTMRRRMRLLYCLLPTACCLLSSGCYRNPGAGGTGEIVVPAKRLLEVNSFDPATASSPPGTTQPTSQPTTQPTTQASRVELSIERVREMALRNNL